eukprot:CAMPEP_0195297464 /NCGR_PEP_ID=MMETSP0707-20130614/21576_1 /TAXON_ID=33640 /ORGANISM="Asterionellopsis glacialis, Strain CCMP134" /LENGTH=149 /DNA_ID=CAMNT_0040359287 /DNA_START=684 /DNA_END=1130 /DNA_ORIENTATION=-
MPSIEPAQFPKPHSERKANPLAIFSCISCEDGNYKAGRRVLTKSTTAQTELYVSVLESACDIMISQTDPTAKYWRAAVKRISEAMGANPPVLFVLFNKEFSKIECRLWKESYDILYALSKLEWPYLSSKLLMVQRRLLICLAPQGASSS